MNVTLKRSIRAKRISIKIKLGQIILTVPINECVDKAYKFLNSHIHSLENQLSKYRKISFNHGAIINILGKKYNIIHDISLQKRIILTESELIISNVCKKINNLVIQFLCSHLMHKILEIIPQLCNKIKVSYNKISVKIMNSKWGSCDNAGNLSFNWKLVFFEERILEYIIVHEICHLKEMNHSKNFWQLVENIYPNWREARAWLKDEGRYII